MPEDKDKPKAPQSRPDEDQMGDYYTGGRAIQDKEFGAGQSAVEGQQQLDPGYPGASSADDQDKPQVEGGQGGSQSGFGGYGAGPGSLERQASRTDAPGSSRRRSSKDEPDEPDD